MGVAELRYEISRGNFLTFTSAVVALITDWLSTWSEGEDEEKLPIQANHTYDEATRLHQSVSKSSGLHLAPASVALNEEDVMVFQLLKKPY